MGAANVGPEFTELEYNGLMELVELQDTLFKEGKIAKPSRLKDILWESVISSGRWKKWLHHDENSDDFYANSPERQEWFIKTGCRYIWENPGVLASRSKLYNNLSLQGIDAEQIVESSIESAMDKYFYSFNLSGLNNLL
jgi:tagatose-1,6-bisphosphate aldolase non-catalytic subunit AgaZ/GatZ